MTAGHATETEKKNPSDQGGVAARLLLLLRRVLRQQQFDQRRGVVRIELVDAALNLVEQAAGVGRDPASCVAAT